MNENFTNVKLMYVPLDNEYKHTLYFKDKSSQLNYFNSVSGANFSNFSYQRNDSKLRVTLSFDEALKYNYVMYQNTAYNNKWFYAFIIDYEWKNEGITELTLETDVMQTYLPANDDSENDYDIKPSFVEREHTKDDTIGANTIPENLEMGEYVVNASYDLTPFKSVSIVVGVTMTPNKIASRGSRYTGCYSGIKYYAFKFTTQGVIDLNDFLSSYDEAGINDSIISMFLAPSELATVLVGADPHAVEGSETPYNQGFPYERNLFNLKNYEPKNNKLLTYPYQYLLMSNNNGGSAIYQLEHFSGDTILFYVYGVLCPGCSIRLLPSNYKGVSGANHEEGLNLGKYPICNWSSDEYTNWLTQNSVNIGLNLAMGLGETIAGVALAVGTGGLGTAIGGSTAISGVSTITNQLTQIHQMSFTPPQANGNINSGDVVTAINKNTFTIYHMCCKPEYMSVIDDYFSMFGYKTNRVKIPNKDHRSTWWFTKTVDINIVGDIPITDLSKLKSCYNNGITFWRNADQMRNYNLDNDIV